MEMSIKEDRINSLPDDVLSHILSFLDLREAVKTCVLSKRWEKVWTLIHCIHLNSRSWIGDLLPAYLSPKEEAKRRTRFINFANGVLTGYNTTKLSVTSFCLSYYFGWGGAMDEIPNVAAWIAGAVTPNLEKLDLFIYGHLKNLPQLIKLPDTLFECQKLVTLKLISNWFGFIRLDVPKRVRFSSLKKLRLSKVKIKDENSLKKLLAGCPVLEELYLQELEPFNDVTKKQTFFIVSPSLKIIRIEHFACFYGFGSCYVVEAPKLEHLDVLDHYLLGFSMSGSRSLVSAVINISTYLDYCSPSPVVELFQGIFNVQKLEISTRETTILRDELANLPVFCNLMHLRVGRCVDSHIVPYILQHSPQLKRLIFDEDHFSYESFMWNPPNQVPNCLILHLETIEILSLSEKKEVMEVVEYLLDKGKVLKKMVITSPPNEKLFNQLMRFSKASVGCQISICKD